MAESLDDINKQYATDRAASNLSDADWAKSSQFSGYAARVNQALGSLTDPTEIQRQKDMASSQLNDPTYGAAAQERINTLNGLGTPKTNKPVTPGTPGSQGLTPGQVSSAPLVNPFPGTGIASPNKGQDTAGVYTPQDQSVASRIPGLLSTDNPIVQTQVGQAQIQANSRGLQNSSMAVEAGQKAAEASVIPIASQDASAVAAQNLSLQNAGQTGALQGQQIQGNLANTGLQTQSAERISAAQIEATRQNLLTQIGAQNAQLAASLGSQANLQAASLAYSKQALGLQLTSQEKIAADQLKAAASNLGLQLTSNETIAARTASNTAQQQVAATASQYAGIYQDAVNQINNNKDLTADARQAALQIAQSNYNNNMTLLTNIYNVKLTWSTTIPEQKPPTPVVPPI